MTELSDTLDDLNGERGCQKSHQEIQDLVEDKCVNKYGRGNVYTNLLLRDEDTLIGEIDVLALTPYGPRVFEIKSRHGEIKAKRQAKKLREYFGDPGFDVIMVSPYHIKRL